MGLINLEALKNFRDSKYARQLVFKTDNVEIILMCWLPGQGTPVHDHGRSDALTMVVEGEMTCATYGQDHSVQRSVLSKGEIEHIAVGIKHEAWNNSQNNLVTLHIYSPPLEAAIKEQSLAYDNQSIEKSVEHEDETRKYFIGTAAPENTTGSKKRKTIVIIGAGFSGSLVASHLLKAATEEETQVILIERAAKFARGFAYSTNSSYHLLNVPAGKMSALPDQQDHFLRWAQKIDENIQASTFVPRMLYGQYLETVLNEAIQNKSAGLSFKRINDEALSLSIDDKKKIALIHLESGIDLQADQVVLALGNHPSKNPSAKHADFYSSDKYVGDPWSNASLSGVKTDDVILLVGTGLTMVDKAIELNGKKHHGKIYALSRHGLVPQKHDLQAGLVEIDYAAISRLTSLREILKFIRQEIKLVTTMGGDWRAYFDGLRPYTQKIWQKLSLKDKKRFFRHLRPYWDVHRHRIPTQAAIVFDTMLNAGQLELLSGRIQNYQIQADKVQVTYIDRNSNQSKTISVSKVINCTGSEIDFCQIQDPLIVNLIKQGLLCSDELALGLKADEHGALIDTSNKVSDILFTLGPPLKGQLWESTAVPEIRMQAKKLAQHLTVVHNKSIYR